MNLPRFLRQSATRATLAAALLGWAALSPLGEPPALAKPAGGASDTPARVVPAPPTKDTLLDDPSGDRAGPKVTLEKDTGCARGMVLVEGEHCAVAEQRCVRWLDPPPYQNLRCAEYAQPATCRSAKKPMRFCIDREEYADPTAKSAEGEPLPLVRKSWLEAKAICEARGARLCREREWELACEGPEMQPYPYGWKRDVTACNFDRTDLGGAEENLTDHRAAVTSYPACVSPYGVRHMVGNVDEWTEREGGVAPNRSALRGGWWLPGRNRCRAATLGHTEDYGGKQVGFRCCAEAEPATAAPAQALN